MSVKLHPKIFMIAAIALISFALIWMYVNDTLQQAQATADSVNILLTPQTAELPVTGGEVILVIQTQDESKKISGFDITLVGRDYLRFVDVEEPISVGGNSVTSQEIKRDVSDQNVRLIYIFQEEATNLPNAIQLKLRIKGGRGTSGTLDVTSATVTGTTSGISFTNGTIQSGNYNFASTSEVAEGPSNFQAVMDPGGLGVLLTWDAADALHYIVKRSTTPGGPYIIIGMPGFNSFNDNTAQYGQTYYYGVSSATPSGESKTSELTFTVPPFVSPTAEVGVNCAKKSQGDANCDDAIDLLDFEIWRREIKQEKEIGDADFNVDARADLIDYEIWRQNYYLH